MKNKNQGITLIALVITIITLLILAGVSILSLSENGIFEKARIAREQTEMAQEKEQLELIVMDIFMDTNGQGITREGLIEKLNKTVGENGECMISEGKGPWTLTFIDSKRSYQIDEKGKVISLQENQKIEYTVIYSLNGGTGDTIENKTVKLGESITLNNGTSLSKENYTLQSWNTKADGTGTDYELGATIIVPGNITLYAKWVDSVVTFDYTNGEQIFTVPVSGTYKLETWGAQGGSYNGTYHGGYGGYSVGEIYLEKGTKLYINVGGAGTLVTNLTYTSGGYNRGRFC